MAAERSRRAGKGRAEAPDDEASEAEPESNFRFNIAKIYGLHFDCPHAACKRHRICSRPATVPCYGRHLRDLRRYIFPQMRRDLERMQRERDGARAARPPPSAPPAKAGAQVDR
jgi:hypothetical protein